VYRGDRGRWNRPELQHLVDHLRKGDVLVGDLDRLSRFLRDVLRVMERIQRVKTVFRSFTGGDRYGHLGRPIDEADDWIVHRV
jgi:DNA invertase Pin-like site-specific DNA recombinase